MINRKDTFILGVFLIIVWIFFGIPKDWKIFVTIASAVYLIVTSVKISMPKKNIKGRGRREKVTSVFVESIPAYPKENIVDGIKAPNQDNQNEVK